MFNFMIIWTFPFWMDNINSHNKVEEDIFLIFSLSSWGPYHLSASLLLLLLLFFLLFSPLLGLPFLFYHPLWTQKDMIKPVNINILFRLIGQKGSGTLVKSDGSNLLCQAPIIYVIWEKLSLPRLLLLKLEPSLFIALVKGITFLSLDTHIGSSHCWFWSFHGIWKHSKEYLQNEHLSTVKYSKASVSWPDPETLQYFISVNTYTSVI